MSHKSQIKDQTKIESFIMILELRMCERELKKEWIEVVNWVSPEWLSVSQPQGRRNRGREHRDKWSERRNVRRGESLCFGVCVNWAEVGFRYKSNGAFCILFFFPGLNRSFRLIQARVRANRPESEPRRRELAKNTWNPRGTTRPDVRTVTSPAHRRAPPHRTRVRHFWSRVRAL